MSERLKPVGINLTVNTKAQLYKIAAFLRVKRTHAIIEMFEFLFNELVNDKGFIALCDAWDRAQRLTKDDKSSYTSFYISQDYIKKFEDIMYDFGFIDRSPFLRLIIDYVYNHKVYPVEAEVLPKIKKDLQALGYKVVNTGPILDGNIYVFLENPLRKTSGKRKTKTKKDD